MVEEEIFTLGISIRRFILVLTFILFKKESSISEAVKVKLVEEKKSFISQRARKDMLKFGQFSYSVGSIRDREDASSHLPVDSFKKDK